MAEGEHGRQLTLQLVGESIDDITKKIEDLSSAAKELQQFRSPEEDDSANRLEWGKQERQANEEIDRRDEIMASLVDLQRDQLSLFKHLVQVIKEQPNKNYSSEASVIKRQMQENVSRKQESQPSKAGASTVQSARVLKSTSYVRPMQDASTSRKDTCSSNMLMENSQTLAVSRRSSESTIRLLHVQTPASGSESFTTFPKNQSTTSRTSYKRHAMKNRTNTSGAQRDEPKLRKILTDADDNRLTIYNEETQESNIQKDKRSEKVLPLTQRESRLSLGKANVASRRSEDIAPESSFKIQSTSRAEERGSETSGKVVRRNSNEIKNLDMLLPPVGEHYERPIFVSYDYWDVCAEDETNKAKQLRSQHPLTGQCSVLCLDISASIEGEGWETLKRFVSNYLQTAEEVSVRDNLQEHIAIVTFGHETRVVHHATTDYKMLRDSLETLQTGGPSPMYAGLLLSQAVAADGTFIYEERSLPPRIILVSDGYITPGDMIAGPDDYLFLHELKTFWDLEDRTQIIGSQSLKINVVPVGMPNIDMLKQMAKITYGLFLDTDTAREEFYRSFKNFITALDIDKGHRRGVLPFTRLLLEMEARRRDAKVTRTDVDTMELFLHEWYLLKRLEEDEKFIHSHVPSLPPVGTRVRRGPEWVPYDVSDGHGPGTVIGIRPEGRLHVMWDCRRNAMYRYGGADGAYEVVIADDIIRFNGINFGSLVKRGPQWQADDEDGGPGAIGVAYRVEQYKIIHVRWPNGVAKPYKFGFCGKFEIHPCNDEDIERYKTNKVSGKGISQADLPSHAHETMPSTATNTGYRSYTSTNDDYFMDDLLHLPLHEGQYDDYSLNVDTSRRSNPPRQMSSLTRHHVAQLSGSPDQSRRIKQQGPRFSRDSVIPYTSTVRRNVAERPVLPKPVVPTSAKRQPPPKRNNKNEKNLRRTVAGHVTPKAENAEDPSDHANDDSDAETSRVDTLNERNKQNDNV